ncbi:hypothetical protein AcV7_009524 [Taiwanofungus camphoratus]|nr:hypothetical protein AcV7_009524 [Antrodia cinnamomea]
MSPGSQTPPNCFAGLHEFGDVSEVIFHITFSKGQESSSVLPHTRKINMFLSLLPAICDAADPTDSYMNRSNFARCSGDLCLRAPHFVTCSFDLFSFWAHCTRQIALIFGVLVDPDLFGHLLHRP